MTWKDAEDIAIALVERHRDTEHLTPRATELRQWDEKLRAAPAEPPLSGWSARAIRRRGWGWPGTRAPRCRRRRPGRRGVPPRSSPGPRAARSARRGTGCRAS